jgi:hypothetical protein
VDGKIGAEAKEEWQRRGVLDAVKRENVGNYATAVETVKPVSRK